MQQKWGFLVKKAPFPLLSTVGIGLERSGSMLLLPPAYPVSKLFPHKKEVALDIKTEDDAAIFTNHKNYDDTATGTSLAHLGIGVVFVNIIADDDRQIARIRQIAARPVAGMQGRELFYKIALRIKKQQKPAP
jgi:hypothetical protein